MASYSIRDLEKLSGIKAHTIRIWEKRYNLIEPARTQTNIRLYSDEDLKKILNISVLSRNKIKISHIAQLTNDEIGQKVADLTKNNYDSKTQINNLVMATIELDEKRFEKIINTTIIQTGFEETILHTIYPFLEKIGILWQTGVIKPAQEHFMTNLIRQKLIMAIDGIIETDNPEAKAFVLFLQEGELHEIGLLFYYYLLKKRGHNIIYLGQSVPFSDIEEVIKIRKCDYIVTSFSSNITGMNILEYLKKLAITYKNQKIFFSAYEGGLVDKKLPPNLFRINNALHFRELIMNLG